MTRHPLSPQRLADEQGWVLVSATILTLLMLSIGLVTAGLIDNGSRRTREQRERESALNVDEGVLSAQTLVMQTVWPSSANNDPVTGRPMYYPTVCTSSSAARHALSRRAVAGSRQLGAPASAVFANVDQLQNVSWATKVRDNGGALATAYDAAKADNAQLGCVVPAGSQANACTYDANKDRELWVQSQAIVRGKPRNVVARVSLEQLAERVPQTGRRRRRAIDHQQRQPRRHTDHRRRRVPGRRALHPIPRNQRLRELRAGPDHARRPASRRNAAPT